MMIVHVYDTIYVTQFEFITLFTWFTATIWDWYNYVHIQMRKLKSEEFICLNPVSCVVRYRSKIWISHLSPDQVIQNYFPCSKIIHCVSVSMISSVQFSYSVVSDSLRPHESQHARPPCPSPTPRIYSNSCPSSRWCHPAISSSVVPFSSCLQSLLASGSFPMSQLFTWGGQSIGVSAPASVLPMNTQDWWVFKWTRQLSLFTHDKLRKMLSSLIYIFYLVVWLGSVQEKKLFFVVVVVFNLRSTSCLIVGMIIVTKPNSEINILSVYDVSTLRKTLLVFTQLGSWFLLSKTPGVYK